jgi:hypothetical protein
VYVSSFDQNANNTDDHLILLDEAIASLPKRYRSGHSVRDSPHMVEVDLLIRADSTRASHGVVTPPQLCTHTQNTATGHPTRTPTNNRRLAASHRVR